MSNVTGWKLSLGLITKHFGKLGDSLAESLASFDPETATQLDRENLQAKMREVAVKLAEARASYAREQKEADELRSLITKDEKAAQILIGKFQAGDPAIDEHTLNEFADELEANRQRLPQEDQEAKDAKELLDTLTEILNTFEQRLSDFDRKAKEATRLLHQAEAAQEQQRMRLQQQDDLRALKDGVGSASTALAALSKRADKLRTQAEADRIVADIGQKPLDRANAVNQARKLAEGDGPTGKESAVERLNRLTGSNKPAP